MERDVRKSVVGDARSRIVSAGIRCVVRDGLPEASMAAIAHEAEVSKALLHYHFADRSQLLAEMTTLVGRRLITREQAAIERDEVSAPVDVLWQWLKTELERGELRALLELGTLRDAAVRDAVDSVATARRSSSATVVEYLFARLGLTARVPLSIIADASVIFIDGLANDRALERDARVSFDVFWLGMLSLGD
jgi:AcrR family transcriptional regulator